jgi:isopentenyl diphosphate isomerase/L-lactate dehydrogenase-like FMN-dependent dehydrogenase
VLNKKLDRALNIEDLRVLAKRRLPKAMFDFIDGGAEDEVTVRNNRKQFERWGFQARFPVDVSNRSTAVELFGDTYAAPLIVSPTGLAGLHRGRADVHLARGAHRVGVPFTLGTVATVSIEDVAAETDGPLWFQLYILRDRNVTTRLIERARVGGYKVLVLTVDCPVAGSRERDPRNGFTLPLRVTAANVLDVLGRLPWLLDMARHGEPRPVNMLDAAGGATSGQALAAYMQSQLDPTVSWDDVKWVRSLWKGPMVVKGIISEEDARIAVDLGANGVTVSNHGGRQLDGAIPTLEALPQIAEAVGDRATVLCDSGFRRGTDVAKALALGARAVCLGRATLFGLAAGGEDGVFKALSILKDELDRTMALTGCRTLSEVSRERIVDLSQTYV